MLSTAHHLLTALMDKNTAVLNVLLRPNAYLQVRGNGQMQICCTRPSVRQALLAEFTQWERPTLNIIDSRDNGRTVTVTFQIEATANGRVVNHKRFAIFTMCDGQVEMIILYCYDEIASGGPIPGTVSLPVADSPRHRIGFEPALAF